MDSDISAPSRLDSDPDLASLTIRINQRGNARPSSCIFASPSKHLNHHKTSQSQDLNRHNTRQSSSLDHSPFRAWTMAGLPNNVRRAGEGSSRNVSDTSSSSSARKEINSISNYTLGDCLGRGAFGSVYRALNWTSGETVAVKQIQLANIPKSELGEIMSEIDLLKNLKHPNIVKYKGSEKTRDHLFIVLEYCENGSLQHICKRFGKFPEGLVSVYIYQVLEGLLYLHDQGVIHRDIKGANILTTKDGSVKLADFGVATRTGAMSDFAVVGSPYWMAPEVIDQSGATTASDIWSVGCVVIELLEGKPPYHFLDPMPALFRIVQDDCPPLPEGASAIVKDFLQHCFQKDANLRVSAKKLLRHPWMASAKRQLEQMKTGGSIGRAVHDEAVKSVQEWNEALRDPPKPVTTTTNTGPDSPSTTLHAPVAQTSSNVRSHAPPSLRRVSANISEAAVPSSSRPSSQRITTTPAQNTHTAPISTTATTMANAVSANGPRRPNRPIGNIGTSISTSNPHANSSGKASTSAGPLTGASAIGGSKIIPRAGATTPPLKAHVKSSSYDKQAAKHSPHDKQATQHGTATSAEHADNVDDNWDDDFEDGISTMKIEALDNKCVKKPSGASTKSTLSTVKAKKSKDLLSPPSSKSARPSRQSAMEIFPPTQSTARSNSRRTLSDEDGLDLDENTDTIRPPPGSLHDALKRGSGEQGTPPSPLMELDELDENLQIKSSEGCDDGTPRAKIQLQSSSGTSTPTRTASIRQQNQKSSLPSPSKQGLPHTESDVEDYSDVVSEDDEPQLVERILRLKQQNSVGRRLLHPSDLKDIAKGSSDSADRIEQPQNNRSIKTSQTASELDRAPTSTPTSFEKYQEKAGDEEDYADAFEENTAVFDVDGLRSRRSGNGSRHNDSDSPTSNVLELSVKLSSRSWLGDKEDDQNDPFAEMEEEEELFPKANDLESNVAREQHARVVAEVQALVEALQPDVREDELIDTCDQLETILVEQPELVRHFLQAHGALTVLGMLESIGSREVICRLLFILNTIAVDDMVARETLCLIGAIPIVMTFTSKKHSQEVRIEAAHFIHCMCSGPLTLQFVLSCRGLKTLVELVDEDYNEQAELVWLGVGCVNSVLELQTAASSRNDFCRMLAQEGLLEPLSSALLAVMGDEQHDLAHEAKDHILRTLLIYSQSDTWLKQKLAVRSILRRLLKASSQRELEAHSLVLMLKIIKNLSMSPTVLEELQNCNVIDALSRILADHHDGQYGTEMSNQVLNAMYNLCRLNKSRQEEAASAGIIPQLLRIASTSSPLKQFALPILCDFAHAGKATRKVLWQYDGMTFYLKLLEDPYWQTSALESILIWLQEETARVEDVLERRSSIDSLLCVFTTAGSNSFENLLEPLLKILRLSPTIVASRLASHLTFFKKLIERLGHHKAVVRLNLLRILKLLCEVQPERRIELNKKHRLQEIIETLSRDDPAVLVRELAREISSQTYSPHSPSTPKQYSRHTHSRSSLLRSQSSQDSTSSASGIDGLPSPQKSSHPSTTLTNLRNSNSKGEAIRKVTSSAELTRERVRNARNSAGGSASSRPASALAKSIGRDEGERRRKSKSSVDGH
ncbi:unnamed protein product [Sympodiomycopsis kandeliae]